MTTNQAAQIDDQARHLAKVLWDYHVVTRPLVNADFILALGSHDERVAIHASALVLIGVAPTLVVSGGLGKVTQQVWSGQTEAERFAAAARRMGLTDGQLILETKGTNTGENITASKPLLLARNHPTHSGILVTKPYMCRRALATARQQWPEVTWQVSGPPIDYDSYPNSDVPERTMINLMVGDLQRMWVYAARGFQAAEEVPSAVRRAYDRLVALGFDEYVIDE